jgi:adenylylsulfate kinase
MIMEKSTNITWHNSIVTKKTVICEIPEFTGISSPYEAPSNPEITIETNEMTIEESVYKILLFLVEKKIL